MHEFTNDENSPMVLATTSIQETWGKDEKILFIDEGCLKFSHKNIWRDLDFSVLKSLWKDTKQNKVDSLYLNQLNEILLERLSVALNIQHDKSYSVKYWRILIGAWLKFFIHIYYDRWKTITYVDEHYKNIKMYTLVSDSSALLPNDTGNFFDLVSTDIWNEYIYHDIAKKWTNIKIQKLGGVNLQQVSFKNRINLKSTAIRIFLEIFHKFKYKSSYKYRNSKYFIYYPYLNFKSRLQLNLKLKNSLVRFHKHSCPISNIDTNFRNWNITKKGDDLFLTAITEIIPHMLPKCFLEGYEKLITFNTNWPVSPKVIMTANAFATDPIWSAWVANLVEKGSKLVIAQHGGVYGTFDSYSFFDYELSIADKYITWGWIDQDSKTILKGPAVKLINLKRRNKNLGKKCLLVLVSDSRYSRDLKFNLPTKDMPNYLNDQFRFAKSLAKNVQKELQVRLYEDYFEWNTKERWEEELPSIELVNYNVGFDKILSDTKLCVCTYNSTTFLETFTRNIPTVIHWNQDANQLNSKAQYYFDLLHKVSILHYTPEGCAEFINSIWDDIPGWWNSVQVRQAVTKFSNNFANVGPNPISKLHSILTDW